MQETLFNCSCYSRVQKRQLEVEIIMVLEVKMSKRVKLLTKMTRLDIYNEVLRLTKTERWERYFSYSWIIRWIQAGKLWFWQIIQVSCHWKRASWINTQNVWVQCRAEQPSSFPARTNVISSLPLEENLSSRLEVGEMRQTWEVKKWNEKSGQGTSPHLWALGILQKRNYLFKKATVPGEGG